MQSAGRHEAVCYRADGRTRTLGKRAFLDAAEQVRKTLEIPGVADGLQFASAHLLREFRQIASFLGRLLRPFGCCLDRVGNARHRQVNRPQSRVVEPTAPDTYGVRPPHGVAILVDSFHEASPGGRIGWTVTGDVALRDFGQNGEVPERAQRRRGKILLSRVVATSHSR